MEPKELVIRCYAEKKGELWHAVCVDLCLAAQGDSFCQVKKKLHDQMVEYVYDALAGEDKEFGADLLRRKAPLALLAKYHYIKARVHFDQATSRLFTELLPMAPIAA